MVQKLLALLTALLLTLFACNSIISPSQTNYQKKNITKFSKSRYFLGSSGHYQRRRVRITNTGSYRHPAVTDYAKWDIKRRAWSKKEGEGKIE